MSKDAFKAAIRAVTSAIAGQPLDSALEARLNQDFAPASAAFAALAAGIQAGVAEGWACAREHGGIKYGRVFAAEDELAGFSVDIVRMENLAGPHHRHPGGEIDLILPITDGAKFDGAPLGWKVYGPDSAHCPTVSDGAAYVLYLLPGGQIEFTK